jgi:hypothetical protein
VKIYPKTLAIGLFIIIISTNSLTILSSANSEISYLADTSHFLVAGGPYGTFESPLYEGDLINFQAEIINGDVSDYFFRWDTNNDGIWEKDDFGSQKGSPTYSHVYKDDYVGLSKVEAWDGVSYRPQWEDGTIFSESLLSVPQPVGSSVYKTIGMKFHAHSEITINQLGIFNDPVDSYILIFNVRLWTESGKLIQSINNPEAGVGTWTWLDLVPVTLDAGENYIISLGIGANQVPTLENPGITSDGVIEPLEFLLMDASPFGFPETSYSTSFLPMVDMQYAYNFPVPDVKEDFADVYVLNAAPIVEAGVDLEINLEETAIFAGGFFDPGSDDTHEIQWDFGDGNNIQGILNPQHIYDNPGTYVVTLTVTDDDGGIGTDTLTVSVLKPLTVKDLIWNLKDTIIDLDLPNGLENSMTSTLSNALASFENGNNHAAENKIRAFIFHVRAQKGKKIPNLDAGTLIGSASDIINLI